MIHFLGAYTDLSTVWKKYPNGGGFGDYITLNGVRVDWNEYTRSWGENTESEGIARPAEVMNGSLDVLGEVTARDGLNVGGHVKGVTGAGISKHGDADFRTASIDVLTVKHPVTGELMPIAELIKEYRTELPPQWEEYRKLSLFDDARFLVFINNSQEKYYTTFKDIKRLILSNVVNEEGQIIQIIRSDEVGFPSDNNVFSAKATIAEIKKALEAVSFDEKYLRKDIADSAKEVITFEKGAEFGEYSSGIQTGRGARIDEEGNLEAQSAVIRSFLEVPTIKYNEQEYLGETTVISAGGVIEEVTEMMSPEGEPYFRIKLKLDDGKNNHFQKDDILKGIFMQVDNVPEGEMAGFQTSWFGVVAIDSEDASYMDIVMGANADVPGGRNYPPRKFMNIAKRGNFSLPDRQFCIELSSKTGNIVMYDGVDNYNAGFVSSQWGKPSGLEFINGYDDLPINKQEALQYVKTLLVQNIIRIGVDGAPVKEITDRGAWDLATAQNEETKYRNNATHIDDVWHKATKYRCMSDGTPVEPTDSEYNTAWRKLLVIEGVVGDSTRFKYKNSATKPDRPTEATIGDWRNAPDVEDVEAPDLPLEPVGPNLYDKNYMVQRGWTDGLGDVSRNVTTQSEGNMIDSSKLKPNTQYTGLAASDIGVNQGRIMIEYSDGTKDWDYTLGLVNGVYITAAGKTVVNINTGTGGMTWVGHSTYIYELSAGQPAEQDPAWFVQEITTEGITTWTAPSLWISEGQVGASGKSPEIRNGYWWAYNNTTGEWYNTWVKAEATDGKDGIDGIDGKDGKGVNMKAGVANYDALIALPESGNMLWDARMTFDTGHLWIWEGPIIKWKDAGPFRGPKGLDGTNYLPFGFFDMDIEYQLTTLGIPLVKELIGTGPSYLVYTLHKTYSKGAKPSQNCDPADPNRDWDLAENTTVLMYMEKVYAEKLQAELVTADKIKAVYTETDNLVVKDGAKIGGFDITDGKIKSSALGKKIVIDPSGLGVLFLDSDSNTVGSLSFNESTYFPSTDLRLNQHYPDGSIKKNVTVSGDIGFIITEYYTNGLKERQTIISDNGSSYKRWSSTGVQTSQVIYDSNGTIVNGTLKDLTDVQANSQVSSGQWYRTGRVLKVMP